MEPQTEILIYFDGIDGEAKRGRLLRIDHLGYYRVKLFDHEGGYQIALLPISRTFLVAAPVNTEKT